MHLGLKYDRFLPITVVATHTYFRDFRHFRPARLVSQPDPKAADVLNNGPRQC